MPFTSITFIVATCDVCGVRYGETDDHLEDYAPVFTCLAEAVADLNIRSAWTVAGDRLICPASDPSHDDQRDALHLASRRRPVHIDLTAPLRIDLTQPPEEH